MKKNIIANKKHTAKNMGFLWRNKKMNKADIIRLNQRWIREVEEKINVLEEEIAVYATDITTYRKNISRVEEEDE